METIKVSTSQHVNIDYPVAGLGERLVGALIDLGVYFGLWLVFASVSSGLSDGTAMLVFLIILVATYILYDLICEVFMNGQSVGKKVMKIKVISIDGSQPSIGQYFIRWVFRLIDGALTMQTCALVCIAVSDNKQRLGDMIAGTTLIKTEKRTQLHHLAFRKLPEDYTPQFQNVQALSDYDIGLIDEVLTAYYLNRKPELVYAMATKVTDYISLSIPDGMDELKFLNTVVRDYNYLTSVER